MRPLLVLGLVVGAMGAGSVDAATPSRAVTAAVAHARAVEAFRRGRFAEAYGRFIALADAGHARSATFALWMCEHGRGLFGHDWDCGPDQLVDWSRAAGVAIPDVPTRALIVPTNLNAPTAATAAAGCRR